MSHDLIDQLLNEKQVAIWLGISLPSLQRQRSNGSGPQFVQLSERRIGYRKSAVERWLEARTINRVGELMSTEQAPRTLRVNGGPCRGRE
ncbi:MAG: AlpA family phage regulatory protein [Pseudolabrys sp.]|jgi:predicted DNA-binding transcriptional regulator AlpA